MKKCELVLGTMVKAYKGETVYEITSVNEEVIILNGEKEVKVSTLLKNYKAVESTPVVSEPAKTVEIELPTFQLKLMAPEIAGLLPAAKVEKKVETIYGIKVVKGVNQTCIWKILKKVCENKDEEGTRIAKQLYSEQPEVFLGAVRCLVSKKRINYINSIIEA